ncbi:hypothetical protein KQI89_08685 [Clostridium sp. MSJ-4]|uniref:Uncharacterized protein n=1 Tax=Clostridium simiarum TaxID=2841506 RepID=A0ABS6F028_9CLOT|nr:hypothetical protein [Clostridium simiarum]MBU5591841.1 hypothetical protein [Clostridium simiarum]
MALDINKKSIYRNNPTQLDNICGEIKEEELKKFKDRIGKTNKCLSESDK